MILIDEVHNAQQNLVLNYLHIYEWMWVLILPQNLLIELVGGI